MPLYLLSEPTEPLVAPAIVAALDGWIDAAGASTAAAERLADGAAPLATGAGELLFGFRSRRRRSGWPTARRRSRRSTATFCSTSVRAGRCSTWSTAG